MVAQNSARRLTIMRLNRRHDRGVFGLRNLSPPFSRQRRIGHQRHCAVDQIQLLHQITVVRGKVNLLMETTVRTRQGSRIVHQRVVVLDHLAQDTHLFVRGVTCGQTGGQPLQLTAHHV